MRSEQDYSYPLDIGIAELNSAGALTPRAYQSLAMRVIETHLHNIGMDEQRLIENYRLAWVLLSMTFELGRRIRPRERLTAKTWHSGGGRPIFRRELVFYDGENEPVLRGATFSVLLDMEARKTYVGAADDGRFSLPAGETLLTASGRLRIAAPEGPPQEILVMRPSWTDGVGHVNNERYGDIVYDALTEAERANTGDLRRLEFYFSKEANAGDRLAVHRIAMPDGVTAVTATRPGETRPSFSAKLYFARRGGAAPRDGRQGPV